MSIPKTLNSVRRVSRSSRTLYQAQAREARELGNMPYSPSRAHRESLASTTKSGQQHYSAPHCHHNATIRLVIMCFKSKTLLFYFLFPIQMFLLIRNRCPVPYLKSFINSDFILFFYMRVSEKEISMSAVFTTENA